MKPGRPLQLAAASARRTAQVFLDVMHGVPCGQAADDERAGPESKACGRRASELNSQRPAGRR
jgi:hypothetical protein